ncbi:hypothetical protein DP113_03765 [Brasilonema octagenarum UFV-E1]|uniref:Uncharacterized protein n=1 Tax=Brasilonema sennae CENA114 TaxID=415709 RepID=A0A856M8W8_9CYAN|nr:hypothetical protein DP114_03810 [Brasilonema sennae CENA114]QDL13516.1 hypothetical protein DP113_03765 [Brasilonema octagenarum UFV-E1]
MALFPKYMACQVKMPLREFATQKSTSRVKLHQPRDIVPMLDVGKRICTTPETPQLTLSGLTNI